MTENLYYSWCPMIPTTSNLAWQLGLLSEEGKAHAGRDFDLKLGEKHLDDDRLWMRHAGVARSLWQRCLGADTRAIAFSWHRVRHPIYVLPGSGINRVADLKGRRIALFRVPDNAFDMDRLVYVTPWLGALAGAGLSLADVSVVETELYRKPRPGVPFDNRNFFHQADELFLKQLLRGEVDAIATPLPGEIVRFFGLEAIYDAADDPDPNVSTDLRALAVAADVVRDHRGLVVDFLARLIAAADWARAHPQQATSLLATDLGITEDTLGLRGIDPVEVTRLQTSPEQQAFLVGKSEFLVRHGILPCDPRVEDGWVDGTLLEEAQERLRERA